jgi:capsular exopolysaccharide synthesis family protein
MAESFFDVEPQSAGGAVTLDFKRVLARAIRFWYLIVVSLVATLTISFYKTRYAQRIYPINASIIIRETQEVGGAEFIYKNALIDQYRNYLNEPYIIRSYPLMEKVVRNLNFHVSFLRQGYFMTTDAYEYMPVRVVWCGQQEGDAGRFWFQLEEDERHFRVIPYVEAPDFVSAPMYALGDSVRVGDFSFCFQTWAGRPMKNFTNIPFQLVVQNPQTVARAYSSRLKVDWAEQGSGVINLSLTGTNPQKEVDFLNELVHTYREMDLERKNEAATRTIDFIRDQLAGIRDSLRTVETQLQRFGGSTRMKDMSADAQRLYGKLENFEIQKAELLIRQNYFEYLTEYLVKGAGRMDQVILPSSMGISDPILSALLGKMVELQTEIKLNFNPEQPNNPLVQQKMARITEMKRDVEEAVRTLKSTDKIKMDFIERQLRAAEIQLSSLPVSERQLIAVQRNYALLENLYVFLMQKLSEAGISKASNTSDILPVNPPVAGGAISPKPTQNYTTAFIFGLTIPFIIFVLFELINNRVQSKEDIDKMTSIPFIGGVGHNETKTNLTVRERPKSGVAESFRAMRSNLNYFTGNKIPQVFMVTSSISGEGKTFTTINLATVFALSGKKTLIVGADMRRPKIFEDFGCSNEKGLSTYLSGLHELEQVVQSTAIENLFLVSGGPVPPNPSELLLTDRFSEFIQATLEQFEFVIIDTPPLALVTDAFVISKYVDHTVFVLRQNFSPKQFIRSIDEYYRLGKIKSISILLNDIYKSGLGYGYGQGYAYHYGYSYGYGYGYGRRKNGEGYYSD